MPDFCFGGFDARRSGLVTQKSPVITFKESRYVLTFHAAEPNISMPKVPMQPLFGVLPDIPPSTVNPV
jgi:hypothetical protein